MNDIIKVSNGLSEAGSVGNMLTNFPFHDAKIVDVICEEKRGKKYITLIVDTKTSLSRREGDKLYKVAFKNGEFLQEPERKKDCYIISLDYSSADKIMRVRFETQYFVGEEARSEVMEIEFTEVKIERK